MAPSPTVDSDLSSVIDRIGSHIEPEDTEKSDSARIKEHLAHLKPETITDDDGIDRTVYTYQVQGRDVRVLFYPANELPVSETFFKGKRLHVVGDKPTWRTDEDWNNYLAKLQGLDSTSARRPGENLVNPTNFYGDDSNTDQETLMLVKQSPRALVDLAMATSPDPRPDLANTRKLLADHKTTPEIDDMIDGIIAVKTLDDVGQYRQPDASDTSAEALAVLELQGDKHAGVLLNEKRAKLARFDEERNITDPNKPVELDPQDCDALNKLTAIHVTGFLPQESADGTRWEIPTTFDATRTVPRISWHSTLQRSVGEDAMAYGSAGFATTRYAILSRFGSLIQANGKPHSFQVEDTFFEISPGRRVQIAKEDSVLVRPGNPVQEGELFEEDPQTHEVQYKHAEFTPADIRKIHEIYEADFNDIAVKKRLVDSLIGKDAKLGIPEDVISRVVDRLGGKYYGDSSYGFDHDAPSFVDRLKDIPIGDLVDEYIPKDQFPDSTGDSMRKRLRQTIGQIITSKVKDIAIEEIVAKFQQDSDLDQDQDFARAVASLGIPSKGAKGHSNHALSIVEKGLMRKLNNLSRGEVDQKTFHYGGLVMPDDPEYGGHEWEFTRADTRNETPASRKMHYYLGLI